jgi:hypothetical protein
MADGARQTGTAAGVVLTAANGLSTQTGTLNDAVRRFLGSVKAA